MLRLARRRPEPGLIGSRRRASPPSRCTPCSAACCSPAWSPLAAAATALLALQSARGSLARRLRHEQPLRGRPLLPGLPGLPDRADAGPRRAGAARRRLRRIELDRVSLRYPDTDAPAVDGVSLTVRRGEVIALVGENGSGKTTLAKLIAGLYRPTGGVIRWDGVDVAELDPAATAAQVAVMTQEWWKFPFTAAQNIRSAGTTGPRTRPVRPSRTPPGRPPRTT